MTARVVLIPQSHYNPITKLGIDLFQWKPFGLDACARHILVVRMSRLTSCRKRLVFQGLFTVLNSWEEAGKSTSVDAMNAR